ncbi:MAG: NAD(P)/FAD-dependent oxidoreductase, partial [Pseudomonadota bacterium]
MVKLKLQKVFEPTRIGQMELKNRLVCPPMVRDYGTQEGFVTQRSLDHYETMAKGGVGMIILEATCIDSPRGRAIRHQLVLDDDRFIPGFRNLAEVIHRHGAKVAVQLHHGGGATPLAISHMQAVGPSSMDFPGYGFCRGVTKEEIKAIVIKFARGAERAKTAGLDGVEIHGAHWYILSAFLSPALNKRDDAYGGSLENRARFLIEVQQAVRAAVGKDFPVWCRINGHEFGVENGFTIEEARSVAVMLQGAGADAVHVSGWGAGDYTPYHSGLMYDPMGNLLDLAATVKQAVTIPVIAVGKLDLEHAEKALQENKADLVAMGRSLLADPDLPKKAAEGRIEDIRPCLWCRSCSDSYIIGTYGIRCQVNAALGYEGEYKLEPAGKKKTVLVIGAGPGGMEAARVASLRGHQVILYDKAEKVGGQMNLAAVPPSKKPIQEFSNYLTRQVQKLGVKIELGKEVTPSVVGSLNPDVLIMAVGAIPIVPDIVGIEKDHVIQWEDVLKGRVSVGDPVVIIGGGLVGCEVADYLADQGKGVTIVEVLPEIPMGKSLSMMRRLLIRLGKKKVAILTGARCQEITDRGLVILDKEGQRRELHAQTVVVATGFRPNREHYQTMGGLVPETYFIGDCVEPGRIMDA